jgi:hypothetical protein
VELPAADLVEQLTPDLLRRGPDRHPGLCGHGTQIPANAPRDSGSTCPPSTMIVWPVM